MNTLEFVEMAATQSRNATLGLVSGLEREQLTWRAGPEANPVGFLLWHVFRTEDRYVRLLTGQEETYTTDGWNAAWPLPDTITGERAALTTGNSWTSEEVGAFDIPPLDELLAYGEKVRAAPWTWSMASTPTPSTRSPILSGPNGSPRPICAR